MLEKKYIPDIDGLRALAVISIIIYHIGYNCIPGGFIGVDVFFVISGYLITKNLLFDIESRNFSFFDFYIRRARRLFPALFVTLLLTFIFAYQLFSPTELERFGESLLYTNFSLSNFLFMSEAGYFDAGSELKPLLHTWSLSVEEQFYLVWPFLLVGLLRFRNTIFVLMFLLLSTIISLYASYIYTVSHPSMSFFMLPFRVFEFAIGGLVIWFEVFKLRQKYLYDLLTLIGLGLILYSIFIFTNTMSFPGYIALVPSIGAGLIIYASRYSVIGIVFRNKIAVGIGLISYSLYLVHWPLIVFYKYWKFEDLTNIEKFLLIIVSFIIGFILWKYIEKPWRLSKTDNPKTHFTFIVPSLMLLISFIAANIWGYKGFPNRFPKEYQLSNEELMKERSRYWNGLDKELTMNGAKGEDNIILIGNSYATDLLYTLRENGSNLNITLLPTTHHCSNFGTLPNTNDDLKLCKDIKKRNFSNPKFKDIDRIYLHDNWRIFNLMNLKNTLTEIRTLSKAPIYVFGPKMDYEKEIPDIVKKHMGMSSINKFSQKFQNDIRIEENKKLIIMFSDKYFKINNIHYVDMLSSQCGDSMIECDIISTKNHKFLYFDNGHFTREGAYQLGKKLKINYPELF